MKKVSNTQNQVGGVCIWIEETVPKLRSDIHNLRIQVREWIRLGSQWVQEGMIMTFCPAEQGIRTMKVVATLAL